MSYIQDVLEVMQILAFMSNSKCPELARRFSNQVPMTVTEMMRRVDDFIKFKEAYKSTELPRGSSLSEDKEHYTMEAGHPVRCIEGGSKGRTTIITSTVEIIISHTSLLEKTTGGNAELEVAFGSEGLCRRAMMKFTVTEQKGEAEEEKPKSQEELVEEEILVNPAFPEQRVTIGTQFSKEYMIGVPKWIIRHTLNVNVFVPPVAHKQRVLGADKSRAVMEEVEEWVKAAYLRDYYPLPENDLKIKSVRGFPSSVFWPHIKGTTKSRCSRKTKKIQPSTPIKRLIIILICPFGLKNVGATYQRLVDSAFQTQLGRNLEAYVDDMVIKNKTEQEMVMDIAETFDNL
ncbi:hypothetical protein Tco_0997758 [Tanacetum coccineum]